MTTGLTPTEDLVMEVLAARYRLGEVVWTFSSHASKAIARLSSRGLVIEMGGVVEHSVRASLTDEGKAMYLSPTYCPPKDMS